MSEILEGLSRLKRPRLLVRAARIGLGHYDRDRRLGRILQGPVPASPRFATYRLMALELSMDEARRQGNASYSCTRHVDVLIALMAEAESLKREEKPQEKASAMPSLVRAM